MEKKGYFEDALSDFVFDVAAGGAIRHLVDRGHSVEQIVKELDYPVPYAKVEKAVCRYLSETGILLPQLPEGAKELPVCRPAGKMRGNACQSLMRFLEEYGEENCYLECPFGLWQMQNVQNEKKTENDSRMKQALSCLTSREQEYILGIRWEQHIMYHRLTSRMREISMKLLKNKGEEWRFFFCGK